LSESFNQEGRQLAKALKEFVGSETDVVYAPISQSNKLEAEEQV
jgi:hypothetical protein